MCFVYLYFYSCMYFWMLFMINELHVLPVIMYKGLPKQRKCTQCRARCGEHVIRLLWVRCTGHRHSAWLWFWRCWDCPISAGTYRVSPRVSDDGGPCWRASGWYRAGSIRRWQEGRRDNSSAGIDWVCAAQRWWQWRRRRLLKDGSASGCCCHHGSPSIPQLCKERGIRAEWNAVADDQWDAHRLKPLFEQAFTISVAFRVVSKTIV